MKLKEMIKLITPPIFLHLAQRFRASRRTIVEWEYVPEGWAYAETHPEVKGWNVQDVLETYQRNWPQFQHLLQGTGPLGIAHESTLTTDADINSHNTIMSLAYVLALTAHDRKYLSVLDWGGGIGHAYLLAQALLPDVEIEYHCKDVPLLSNYGEQIFPQQSFYTDNRCFERDYDLVMASTSLHYSKDWQALLRKLAGATRSYLYIANLPSIHQVPSFVFVQRPYQYGYDTEYLAWCLNRTEFLNCAKTTGVQLLREFVYGHRPVIHGAPEQNGYLGYLFRASTEGTP